MAVQLLVSVNGGAPQSGGIDVPSAATIQLSAASTVGWRQQRWEIYDYPDGFATPAGWTLRADGVIYTEDVAPTLITLPANTALWGPWGFELRVDEAVDDSSILTGELVDRATAIHMESPNGLRKPMAFEDTQFCTTTTLHKKWVRTLQRVFDIIEPLLGGASAPVVITNAGTGALDNIVTAGADIIRFTGAAPDVRGLASGTDGRELTLMAIGGNMTITDAAGSSLAANRLDLGISGTIYQKSCVKVVYDGASSRWREFCALARG